MIGARNKLQGSAAISRTTAPIPRLSEGDLTAAEPVTRKPARRNNIAARGR